jgi:hypothetical protein
MSGQKSTTSNSPSGRDLHSNRSNGNAGADVHRPSKSDSRSRISSNAARSGVLGSVSSAQQRWPEYNRIILFVSAGGAAAVITATIVRAIAG